MDPKVYKFLDQAKKWQAEMTAIREIALDCNLTEELKWRFPCYTLEGKNIVLIQAFKEYCALLFFKGALLKDTKKILQAPGDSQAARQLRFTAVKDVVRMKAVIKSYIKEAIKVEEAGLKVEMKQTKDYEVVEEFQTKLNKMPKLKKSFESLTPGRQRQYLLYFSGAKQSKTREDRVKKYVPVILEGKGLND
jgi:uncharacterized protein YdeI (YjbR/CyaY-like superfamily)